LRTYKLIPVLLFVLTPHLFAFEKFGTKNSYIDSGFLTYGTGMGYTHFAQAHGISGGDGFALKLSLGHHFNQFVETEFSYQFSTFEFSSPDPVAPVTQLHTRAAMNQMWLQFVLSYPVKSLQPFIKGGIGAYDLFDVNAETGLHFATQWVFPFSAGVRWYFYRNTISLDSEFNYQLFLGENQTPDRLLLLGLNHVSFDSYSVLTSLVFHFL